MKKIVITGNRGFLGRYLQEKFESEGYEVVGFDLPEHDLVSDDFSILYNVDGVIHLAAMKGIPVCDALPSAAVEANVLGTSRLLEACNKFGVDRFVYASTWACDSPNKKMYDVTKKAAEELVHHFVKNKDLDGVIVRLGTCYGKGMAREGAINAFISRKRAGLPATVRGSGIEQRQFTHAKDIAEGLYISFLKGQSGETYMLTAEETVTIGELAKKICEDNVEFVPATEKPEPYVVHKSEKLKKLGWKQKISLDEGIKEMM